MAETRDLSEAELAELTEGRASGIDLELPEVGGVRQISGAELALLEEESGFAVEVDLEDDRAYADVSGSVEKIVGLRKGGGSLLKVEVIDEAASSDMVNLYDTRDGQRYSVTKTLLRYYLDKTREDGARVFSARPLPLKLPRVVACAAKVCHADGGRTMFPDKLAMEAHFRNKHAGEWAEIERQRERANEDRSIQVLEGLQGVMTMLTTGSTNLTPEAVAALKEATDSTNLNLIPTPEWGRKRIVAWGEAHDFPMTPARSKMNIQQLLVDYGIEEAEEEAVAV